MAEPTWVNVTVVPVFQPTLRFRYKEVEVGSIFQFDPNWKPDFKLQQLWTDPNLNLYEWRYIPMVPFGTPDNCP